MASPTKSHTRFEYGGSWFAAASTLPLEGGLLRQGQFANLLATAVRRPRRAGAFIALLARTRSERVVLSTSVTGRALDDYFAQRSARVFPQNRLCRGVLLLPEHHADYLRGGRRQALRTNLRKADAAGIWCGAIREPSRALDEIRQIVESRRVRSTGAAPATLESWAEMLSGPEMTLVAARDPGGRPLAVVGAVIDDAVCLIRLAVACNHEARWALHDHLVRILIARGVKYLLAEGGGPFGALGLDTNVHHYQRLLGYELRHLRPRRDQRHVRARESMPLSRDLTMATQSGHASPVDHRAGESLDSAGLVPGGITSLDLPGRPTDAWTGDRPARDGF